MNECSSICSSIWRCQRAKAVSLAKWENGFLQAACEGGRSIIFLRAYFNSLKSMCCFIQNFWWNVTAKRFNTDIRILFSNIRFKFLRWTESILRYSGGVYTRWQFLSLFFFFCFCYEIVTGIAIVIACRFHLHISSSERRKRRRARSPATLLKGT